MIRTTLSKTGEEFGFPQGCHFDALVMTDYTSGRKLDRTYTPDGPKFYFRLHDVDKSSCSADSENVVPFDASAIGYFYGFTQENVEEYLHAHPTQSVAYVPENAVPGAYYSKSAPKFIVPVAATLSREDMRAIRYNLERAHDWFLLVVADTESARESQITYMGNVFQIIKRHEQKDDDDFAFFQNYQASESSRAASVIAEMRIGHYVQAAQEIYASSNPPEPTQPGSRPWRPERHLVAEAA